VETPTADSSADLLFRRDQRQLVGPVPIERLVVDSRANSRAGRPILPTNAQLRSMGPMVLPGIAAPARRDEPAPGARRCAGTLSEIKPYFRSFLASRSFGRGFRQRGYCFSDRIAQLIVCAFCDACNVAANPWNESRTIAPRIGDSLPTLSVHRNISRGGNRIGPKIKFAGASQATVFWLNSLKFLKCGFDQNDEESTGFRRPLVSG